MSGITPAMPVEGAVVLPEMRIRVLKTFEEAECFRTVWDDLVTRTGTDIYQTFDWCRIWWRHYGRRRRLCLLLGFSGECLVGVVPAFVEVLWLGPVRIRVAKLVGSDFSLQLCNLAVEGDYLDRLVGATVRYFIGELSCDLLLFGPLSGSSAKVDDIFSAAMRLDAFVQETLVSGNGISTRFELPGCFPDYLQKIGSRQRGNYGRAMKQFANTCRIETDVVSVSSEVRPEFERFAALHGKQWRHEGKLGHFGDWPRAMAFNRDLVESLSLQDKVRFYRILADGKVAISQYCFVHGGVNYWRLPARATNPEWEKLSLGKMGLVKMVEDAITEQISAIEGGRGHYDYKVQLGGREWPLRTIQIMRRGQAVRARVMLFRALAKWLNLAYYRVFFARLAPHVRLLRRSLWSIWIRSTW